MKLVQYSLFAFITIIFCIVSCKRDGKNITARSAHNTNSHNSGTDCMSCHKSSGQAKANGWYVVAGTVFQPNQSNVNANATVYLYSGPNATGNLVYELEADNYGNFYTTDAIDFGNGLYPVVQSSSGTQQYMQNVIRTGNCNGCHNSSQTGKIFVN